MHRVSVIIAAYNGATTIDRAVRSALAQRETAEVIVVDDASTDATAAVAYAAAKGDERVRAVTLPTNAGPAAARNIALDHAIGTLICVLDADDWMEEGRIARLLASAGEGWHLAADDLLLFDPDSGSVPTPMFGRSGAVRTLSFLEFVRANLPLAKLQRREYGYLKPLIRRSFLEEHRLRYDERLRLGEDFVLYATALGLGARFVLTPACGYVAVQRADSLSHKHSAADLLALARADETLLQTVASNPAACRLVRRHQRYTLDKYCHRAALDAKERGDWMAVARALLGTPTSALHVFRETLDARMRPA